MMEEAPKPEQPDPSAQTKLPPLPDYYQIPPQLIEAWVKMPDEQRLTIQVTKYDLDHLLLGITKGLNAQEAMHRCMIYWSNGQIAEANGELASARAMTVNALNDVRQFFASIMISAIGDTKSEA